MCFFGRCQKSYFINNNIWLIRNCPWMCHHTVTQPRSKKYLHLLILPVGGGSERGANGSSCPLGQPKFFFRKLGQTPRPTFGQIVAGHQFSASLDVVWPRLQSSEGPQVGLILTAFGTFRASEAWSNNVQGGWKLVSSHDFAKHRPWSLSQFSKKNLGWPNGPPNLCVLESEKD